MEPVSPTARSAIVLSPGAMKLAYLCNLFPGLSSTFILRELVALRERGMTIEPLSIRKATGPHLLADTDRRMAEETFTVLPPQFGRFVVSHVRALFTRPGSYVRTLRRTLALSQPGPRARLWRLFYFVETMVVWDECRRRGVRHVHAHFANQACDVALLLTTYAGRGWTYSFTVHGPAEFFELRQNRLREKVQGAAFVVCISQFARSQVMTVTDVEDWPKLHVVHCGVDPAVYAPPVEPRDSTTLRILCLGRLVPEKGQAILLDAFERLVARSVDARLTLVGDGPTRGDLEAQVQARGLAGRVVFMGPVGQDDVPPLYEDADVFCLPSFAEGLPVVLMEAMATELPVVTTRIAGVPELVVDGENGLTVPPSDPNALAAALERLAGDAALRRELGTAARAKVLAEFDIRDSAAQLQPLFEGIHAT